jgi:hypothetical protein
MSTVWSVGYATRPRGTGEVFAPALGFGWAAVRAKRGRIAKMENCMLDKRVKLVVRFSELEELQMEESVLCLFTQVLLTSTAVVLYR